MMTDTSGRDVAETGDALADPVNSVVMLLHCEVVVSVEQSWNAVLAESFTAGGKSSRHAT